MKNGKAALCAFFMFASPAAADTDGLQAAVAAGKQIFERTDNNGGCIRCHGADALGSEADPTFAGNNIRGSTAEEIRLAIMALPMMWNVKIDDKELLQVEAYLQYLQDAAD